MPETETTEVDPIEAMFALLHPVFRDCCDSDSDLVETHRLRLDSPWAHEGFVYATDGSIVVRCPATGAHEAVPIAPGKRVKDPAHVFTTSSATEYADEWVPAPEPKALPACEWCGGSGQQGAYVCRSCGDHDKAGPCGECLGLGVDDSCLKIENAVRVGDSLVRWDYARMLHRHGAELCPPTEGPAKFAVKWRIPGTDVEGLVMPMDPNRNLT